MPDQTKKPKVLLVEDDVFMIELLGKELKDAGFDIDVADKGSKAIEKFKEAKPDLILLDILLPDLRGLDVLRQIRAVEGGNDVVVMVLSNIADKEEVEEAKKLGVTDYLVKANFSLTEIREKVKGALAMLQK